MAKNVEAFKALIAKYKSITLEQLHEVQDKLQIKDSEYLGLDTMRELTGFGAKRSCTLCRDVLTCQSCVYTDVISSWEFGCTVDITYDEIEQASTCKELYDAIQERIIYMEEILRQYESNPSE